MSITMIDTAKKVNSKWRKTSEKKKKTFQTSKTSKTKAHKNSEHKLIPNIKYQMLKLTIPNR